MKHLKLDLLLFVLILVWCIGILWNVVTNYFPSLILIKPALSYNYSLVCHTDSNKLFDLWGYETLTCSRCSGIYFGALFSSILLLLGIRKNINTKMLFLSSVPMFIDVILYSIGVYSYSKIFALFTGLFLGSIGFIYIRNSITEILNTGKKN